MKNTEFEMLWIQGQIEMKFDKHAKHAIETIR